MKMPEPDAAILHRRAEIIRMLERLVPDAALISDPAGLASYECDGLTAYRQVPIAVVLPENVTQLANVLRWCSREGVKVVPRGAGTSLSGGALPLADGIVIGMARFNRILEVDYGERVAVVQPGVTNLAISEAVAAQGFYYAPDPSSQIACTIGGNVAENSGGVHCLKYGLTTNNVLGVELVTMEGEVVRLGGRCLEPAHLDLLGIVVGSEGLLGIVTEVTVRILPRPLTATALLLGFSVIADAAEFVADVIAAGIIPAGMELMDKPAIDAAEAFVRAGYPADAQALLIIEVDGPAEECQALASRIGELAQARCATSVEVARDDAERARFWAGRKAAFPAVGRISPDYYCMDGTIPRRRLAEVLQAMSAMSERYGLRLANVFHAGDGNLHPLILFDTAIEGQLEQAEAFGAEILRLCVAVGGVLSGEHGVGVEKRDLMPTMFTPTDLAQQQRIKCAFDPQLLLNPGKVFPQLHRCAELGRMHVHRGRLPFPELPRF